MRREPSGLAVESLTLQVAGVAAKAKSGHYPIDSRLQAVFQAGQHLSCSFCLLLSICIDFGGNSQWGVLQG